MAGQQLLASGGNDGTVRIWDPATGQQHAILEGHRGWVNSVCPVSVAGQELLASGGKDGTVRIWDPATSQRAALEGYQGRVNAVCAVTVNGRELLASASNDRTVRIWDRPPAKPRHSSARMRRFRTCTWIDSGGLAAGGDGGLYGFDILPGANPNQ